jgi:hypothetical protein
MRKLKTSNITTTVGMPIKGGTLDHIQNAYIENFSSIIKNLIGPQYDPTKCYILDGLINTTAGTLTYTITAGSVFYQNEIFQVDAVTLTVGVGQNPNLSINTTFFSGTNADPVTFTDSVPRNVHEIRKIALSVGTTTANISYDNFIPLRAIGKTFSTAGGNIPAGTTIIGTCTGTLENLIFDFIKIQDFVFLNFAFAFNVSAGPANGSIGAVVPMSQIGLPLGATLFNVSLSLQATEGVMAYNGLGGGTGTAKASIIIENSIFGWNNVLYCLADKMTVPTGINIVSGSLCYKAKI